MPGRGKGKGRGRKDAPPATQLELFDGIDTGAGHAPASAAHPFEAEDFTCSCPACELGLGADWPVAEPDDDKYE